MQYLKIFDYWLFEKINSTWTHPWLDQSMPIITDLHKNKIFIFGVVPLFLAGWLYRKRGLALRRIIGMALTLAVSDSVTYRLVKPEFGRLRPHPAEVHVIYRSYSPVGFSFPSNHAANGFAIATYVSYHFPWLMGVSFLGASIVAYSRVYVGAHYPSDVFWGALLGMLLSFSLIIGLSRLPTVFMARALTLKKKSSPLPSGKVE